MWVARLVCGVALFMGVLVLPAHADTISGTYSLPLNTVQGGFTFNTSADVFSGTLAFGSGSIFNGVTESFNQAGACSGGSCALALSTSVGGDSLSYAINLNLSTDQYSASGSISNTHGDLSWSSSAKATYTAAENWGLSDSLSLFAAALLAFGVLTRLGVLRTVHL
jgi:hypothetical protein